jgi:hypothetical protein
VWCALTCFLVSWHVDLLRQIIHAAKDCTAQGFIEQIGAKAHSIKSQGALYWERAKEVATAEYWVQKPTAKTGAQSSRSPETEQWEEALVSQAPQPQARRRAQAASPANGLRPVVSYN